MIIKQYIKDFEKLGLGMYAHFGIYSLLGKGEWVKHLYNIPDEEYYAPLMAQFDPKPDWAKELAAAARKAGCRYVNLTTRHHDGFSLFDTCGLNTLDAMHAKCKRDLVKEFVEACREQGLKPFFYHTLLDWYQETYRTDFKAYLKYLRDSIEILCTNYGEIGGFMFDGMWDKPDEDWEEDALYGCIRKHQPNAMIINNTGLFANGTLGHMELDSVTFERGKPLPINMGDAPKYVASEMSEIMGDHWGYAAQDLNFKSTGQLIGEIAECRKYGANMLLNIGPMGDGSIRPIDAAILGLIGEWAASCDEALRSPRPCDIKVENKEDDFLLKDENAYYLFCYHLPMSADPNVALVSDASYIDRFRLPEKIKSVKWLDDASHVTFEQTGDNVTIHTEPFAYGRNLVVRVAKIEI